MENEKPHPDAFNYMGSRYAENDLQAYVKGLGSQVIYFGKIKTTKLTITSQKELPPELEKVEQLDQTETTPK